MFYFKNQTDDERLFIAILDALFCLGKKSYMYTMAEKVMVGGM